MKKCLQLSKTLALALTLGDYNGCEDLFTVRKVYILK